jgi:hypothetical protein
MSVRRGVRRIVRNDSTLKTAYPRPAPRPSATPSGAIVLPGANTPAARAQPRNVSATAAMRRGGNRSDSSSHPMTDTSAG